MTLRVYFAIFFILTTLCFAQTQTDSRTKIFDVKSADPDSLLKVVKTVVGDDAKVVYMPAERKFVATGTSNQIERITALLDQLNIQVMNVRIDVDFNKSGKKTSSGASVTGSGKPVVTQSGRNSFTVNLTPQVSNNSQETTSNTRQTLVVTSGKAANLFIGEQAPYANWLVDYARQNQIVQQDFEMVNVGSSLRIEPTVIGKGPLLNIKLTPELTGLSGKKNQRIQYAGLTTELTAQDGETITIGGLGKNDEFTKKFLVGFGSNKEIENLNITLTPHIIDPAKSSSPSR